MFSLDKISVKWIKLGILYIIGGFMAFISWFDYFNVAVYTPVLTIYVGGMSSFLCLDLANTLKGSKLKKKSDFDTLNIARYVNSGIIFLALYFEVRYKEKLTSEVNEILKTGFSVCAMAVLVTLLNGLQANALAAKVDGERKDG